MCPREMHDEPGFPEQPRVVAAPDLERLRLLANQDSSTVAHYVQVFVDEAQRQNHRGVHFSVHHAVAEAETLICHLA